MNSDLKIAYIYVTTHEDIDKEEVIQKLDLCKQYLSKKVTGLVNLKFSPKLVFKNDRSLFELNKIEKILKSEKVQKDLKSD